MLEKQRLTYEQISTIITHAQRAFIKRLQIVVGRGPGVQRPMQVSLPWQFNGSLTTSKGPEETEIGRNCPCFSSHQPRGHREGDPWKVRMTAPYQPAPGPSGSGGQGRSTHPSPHLEKGPSPVETRRLHRQPACATGQQGGTVSFALGLLHFLGLLHHCSVTLSLTCRLPAVRQSLGDLFLHRPWEDPIRQDKGSIAVLSSGTFCDDGNVLHAVHFSHRWPLSTWDMASAIEKLNF